MELQAQARQARTIAAKGLLITAGLGKEPEHKAKNTQQLAWEDRADSVKLIIIITSDSDGIVNVD